MSRWPSRRLQIGVMIVLAVGAAITAFMPPLTRHSRAERLYLDGWFEESVPKLEKALALDPGNSIYEQALVYRCPKDKLPRLLKTRRLGKGAQALAAGLIYQHEVESIEDPKRKLVLVDALIKADPTNALPHYRKASILQEMGRLDAALDEIRRGNALGKMRFHAPVVDDTVLDSNLSPALQLQFSDYAKLRRMVRAIVDMAHVRLREGKVEESVTILEDLSRMNVVVSTGEPPTIMSILVGKAMHMITWSPLQPICKDFGMRDRLARMKRLDDAFERALTASREEMGFDMERIALVGAIPFSIVWAAGSAAGFLALSLLWWILPAIRRRGQPAVSTSTWGEGWIARVSLLVGVPLMAIAVHLSSNAFDMDSPTDYLGPYGLLIVLAQIIILALGLRILHHRRDQDTGENTGILRFIFKSPAAAKAWTRKSLMVLFAGQIAFVACLALLAIILYKPFYGGHPWQIGRFELLTISHEQATMRRVGDDLRKAYSGLQPKQMPSQTR